MSGSEQRLHGSLSSRPSRDPGCGRHIRTFISIAADGAVNAYNGHVDLGTGIRTALGQIVAEELDVSFARVRRDPRRHRRRAEPGRDDRERNNPRSPPLPAQAAAQARHFLAARAAERLELPVDDLTIEDGLIRGHEQSQRQLWRADWRRGPFSSSSPTISP